jgi:type II secretory pathway component HofQ
MSRKNAGRLAVGLLATLCLGLYAASGQDRTTDVAKTDDAAKNKRIAYIVQRGTAKDLAPVLAKHFKGEAEVQAMPDAMGNCLLINATSAVFDEVVKLLAQLDRPPQSLVIEIYAAEVPAKKSDDKTDADKALDLKEFTGSAEAVVAKLEALRGKGAVGTLNRLQFTVVEGRPASVLAGESKPFTSGMTVTATGRTARSVMYRNLGDQAHVTAHVGADKKIEIDLEFSQSRAKPDESSPLGKDETGAVVYHNEFLTAKFSNKISVASGQAIAVDGVSTTSKSGKEQTLVVVTARVVDPSARIEREPGDGSGLPDRSRRPRRPLTDR